MGHHYLPRHLLRGFADPHGLLHRFDVRAGDTPQHLKIASVAQESGMYGDELERKMQAVIEDPFNHVLDRVRQAGGSLKVEDKPILARYLLTAIRRVPDGRKRSREALPAVVQEKRAEMLVLLDELHKLDPPAPEIAKEHHDKVMGIFDRALSDHPEWLWRATVLPDNFPRIVGALEQMHWTVLASSPEDQILIGDCPVVRNEGVGLSEWHAEWMLPISSCQTICATWHPVQLGRNRLRPAQVRALNAKTLAQATRYVFALKNEPWIARSSLRPRTR
ncbi:MAG: DUF4238 domain-containing protein [Comamonadaceae bacterium]|nr:MAG: DUF4238 domain-containing protein [Comamonadaceae bacterium]